MTLRLFSIAILLLQVGRLEAAGLELTILADEGLLIRSAESSVLIDAFIGVDDSESGSESVAAIEQMLAGHPPFSRISLAIVSHPHREHFDAQTAGSFLLNNQKTLLASTAEVVEAIRDDYSEYAAIQDRVRAITLDGEISTSRTFAGIRLEFMLLKHEASDFYPEQVLAQIIHIGGKKILYVGDSEMRPETWQVYDLRSQEIDIVVLPLWLFKEASVRAIIDGQIAPKRVVVAEIPRRGIDLTTELAESFPEVVFLDSPMASAQF